MVSSHPHQPISTWKAGGEPAATSASPSSARGAGVCAPAHRERVNHTHLLADACADVADVAYLAAFVVHIATVLAHDCNKFVFVRACACV